MKFKRNFYNNVVREFDSFLAVQNERYPSEDVLTIDLHCHDYNSNIPDELLGRLLGVPETWLPSEDLITTLGKHGCDTFTVTNHNNARSCYELRDMGIDVLTGAEFSCYVPDYGTGIHVLTYGFTPREEKQLNKLRYDIYKFQEYTAENDIPTIWAHPLYHYKSKGMPPLEFFDKMSLLFERFEVLNGQRDTWQNMLVHKWVESLTPERIKEIAAQTGINPDRFCRTPYRKWIAGGSDSHMGIFAGLTGTRLYVPDLDEKLKIMSRSKLALEAIKRGEMAPYGDHNDSEKMTVAFLDYFCQVGLNVKDPGLMRMILHKGDTKEKLTAFALSNAFAELKRHKLTMKFLQVFHECFSGRVPGFTKRLFVSKTYRSVFQQAAAMAEVRRDNPEKSVKAFDAAIRNIYGELSNILVGRLTEKIKDIAAAKDFSEMKLEEILEGLEFPSDVRSIIEQNGKSGSDNGVKINLPEFFDGLSFPFLASFVLLGACFTSTRVLYNSRPLLESFSGNLNYLEHPKRVLWLTDTFEDGNGVSMVLKSMLHEVRERNLPIDILVCSSTLKSEENLVVVPPISEFSIPFYEEQPVRIPNIMDIHRIFKEGEYDRIVCSTEGPMGAVAIYLKQAYTVPAYFYVHTDWMMFAKKVLNFDEHNRSRLRRLLRAFYRGFDGIFVLNTDQYKWFTGSKMGFDASKVFLTAHWAEGDFTPKKVNKTDIFGCNENDPVILFAGRLSEEKGVMELPSLYQKIKLRFPDMKIAIAGKGPCEEELKKTIPDGIFLGWVDHGELPNVYSAADMLVLPSKFDTFGCVVLEALSCGLPVTAYSTKGPKDIIQHNQNGYVVKSRPEMVAAIVDYFRDPSQQKKFKKTALLRAEEYSADRILSKLMTDLKLKDEEKVENMIVARRRIG